MNIYFDIYIYQSLDDKNLQVLSLKESMVETEPEAEIVWEIMLPLLQETKIIRNTPQEVSNCVLRYADMEHLVNNYITGQIFVNIMRKYWKSIMQCDISTC